MKWLESIETNIIQLEIGECDCGYHFAVDATFIEQVGDFKTYCPSYKKEINTEQLYSD